MGRVAGTLLENNFTRALITEATGLNFPENAVTDTENCVFENTGQVRRRLGIDIETEAEVSSYTEDTGAIVEYLWRAVARTGVFTFLVLQIGPNVVFYELAQGASLSSGIKGFAVDLNNYKVTGAINIQNDHCSFASGNGRLFIVHPQCNPIVVAYDADNDTLEQEEILIRVRDFEGVDDDLDIDEQPVSLSPDHLYNLMNQGWYLNVRMVTPGGGAGSNASGTGANVPFDPESLL